MFKNSVNIELAGHGVLYSVNYERILINNNKYKTAAQIGGTYYPKSLITHFLVNEIISFNKHHIELGAGASPGIGLENTGHYFIDYVSLRGGYRYQQPDGNIVFKLAFTPLLALANRDSHFIFLPYAGASFGYAF
ncbi:MAG: hypothetical protein ACXWXW_14565 [Bacteroidia bacterium]